MGWRVDRGTAARLQGPRQQTAAGGRATPRFAFAFDHHHHSCYGGRVAAHRGDYFDALYNKKLKVLMVILEPLEGIYLVRPWMSFSTARTAAVPGSGDPGMRDGAVLTVDRVPSASAGVISSYLTRARTHLSCTICSASRLSKRLWRSTPRLSRSEPSPFKLSSRGAVAARSEQLRALCLVVVLVEPVSAGCCRGDVAAHAVRKGGCA